MENNVADYIASIEGFIKEGNIEEAMSAVDGLTRHAFQLGKESAQSYEDKCTWKADYFINDSPKPKDRISHPTYYNTDCPVIYVKCKCGETLEATIECIDVIRNMPTWKGSTIKYLWRAGLKEEADMTFREKEIEDLRKAIFYIEDRIKMLENGTD